MPAQPAPGDQPVDHALCTFCRVRDGLLPGAFVLEEPDVVAFLDIRPLFPGHVVVIPRQHTPTLLDLPPADVGPFFEAVQRVAAAVTTAMGSQGTFMAVNSVVSQSVPHLHAHVVPRTRGDGLRGFFWPRTRYAGDEEMAAVAIRIRSVLE